MSIFSDLFPQQNRKAATVAFIRTFWQALIGSSVVTTIAGYIAIVNGVIHVDWVDLGYAAGGVVAVGVLSAGKAAGNILVNGLPATYTALAVASLPSGSVQPAPAAPAAPVAAPDPAASVPDPAVPVA